jgi:phosphoglycolate phosphatase
MTPASDAARVVPARTPSTGAVAPLQGALSRAPQAILFDLDGTLVDSVPDLARCVNAALASVAGAAADQDRVRGWVGNGAARLLHRALTGRPDGVAPVAQHEQAMAVFNAHYAAEPCRDSRLYPGVAATLTALAGAGIRLGCVTNKPHRFVQPLLAALGLGECFASIIGGDSTGRLKPDPLPVLAALSGLGVAADRCLLVGDSRIDMAAGQAAGVATVAVSYGYDRGCDFPAAGAVAVLDSLSELPTVWGQPAITGAADAPAGGVS